MDGHFGLDLEAARQHRVGLDEGERKGTVAGHDVGDVGVEQAIDGAADETIAEIVERTLVFLEVRGAQAVADHHVVSLKNLVHHGGCGIGGVGVVSVGHDVHVGINVFEHGANHIALALTWFPAHNRAFAGCDLGSAVGGVVVIHVNIGVRQR